jgi:hypothetical protein
MFQVTARARTPNKGPPEQNAALETLTPELGTSTRSLAVKSSTLAPASMRREAKLKEKSTKSKPTCAVRPTQPDNEKGRPHAPAQETEIPPSMQTDLGFIFVFEGVLPPR